MQNKKRFLLTMILGLVFYLGLFYFLFAHLDLKSWLLIKKELKPLFFPLLFLSGMGLIGAQGFYLKKVLQIFEIQVPWRETVLLWVMTVPLSLASFGLGGAAFLYHQIQPKAHSLSRAVMAVLWYYLFYLLVNLSLLLLIIFLGPAYANRPFFQLNNLILLLFLLFLVFILFWVRPSVRDRLFGLVTRFLSTKPVKYSNWVDSVRVVWSQKGLIALSASLMVTVCNLFVFWLVFLAYSITVHPMVLFGNYLLSEFLAIFSPTGGGVGLVEAGLVGSLKISGLTLAQASLVTLAFRVFSFWIPVFVGYLVLLHFGFRRFWQRQIKPLG
jgi:uncharacterized membrane protein YbhN (UPF0104 family)